MLTVGVIILITDEETEIRDTKRFSKVISQIVKDWDTSTDLSDSPPSKTLLKAVFEVRFYSDTANTSMIITHFLILIYYFLYYLEFWGFVFAFSYYFACYY